MGYLGLGNALSRGIGAPSLAPGPGSISTPPSGGGNGVKSATIRFDQPPQAHIEPPPYDSAKDPAWKPMLVHGGEEFRNFINGLDDGARQMLHSVLTSIQKANPLAGALQSLQGANPLNTAAQALVPPTPGP